MSVSSIDLKNKIGQQKKRKNFWIAKFQQLWLTLELWDRRSRQRRELLLLNEHFLKDIGISAGEAYQEGKKPFWKK